MNLNYFNKKNKVIRIHLACKYEITIGDFYDRHHIAHEVMTTYLAQSNVVTKTKFWTLIEIMNGISISSKLLENIWDMIILTSNYFLSEIFF